MMRDTIFALSSGRPPAGIAVIRISGHAARDVLCALAGGPPEPRKATLRTIALDGEMLDRGLILWFPGPASATGEDVAELHVHGGRAVADAVLNALATLPDTRLAEPGEFTRRAFENGRIDLAEAEGLGDLLGAETDLQRRRALQLSEGGLSALVREWSGRMIAMSAEIEAAIDFSDEDDVPASDLAQVLAHARALAKEIGEALAAPPAERLRDGVRVVIAGPPNTGKSSLLNALAGRPAALVSKHAGTTRDAIEAPVVVFGVPLVLVDTAGLRDADDPVERLGVARAQQLAEAADIVLWLGSPEDAPDRAVLIRARCDIIGSGAGIPVSARTGEGIPSLRDRIAEFARALLGAEPTPLLNLRHRTHLVGAVDALCAAGRERDVTVIAELFRRARAEIGAVTGGGGLDVVLDEIFGRFCLGK